MKKAAQGYFKAMDILYKIVENIALLFLVATVTLLFIQTGMRYLLNHSLSWAEELCRYMCIWMAFLGSGIGIRDGIHVGFDLLKNRLPESLRNHLELVLHAAVLVGSFVIIKHSLTLMDQVKTQISSSMGFPMSYVYVSMLIGAILVALYSLEGVLRKVVKEG